MPTIAVIFDFDDTLVPDSTTKLLKRAGIDPDKFWKKDVKSLVASGFDTTLAYLKLLIDNIGDGKPLGTLTNKGLREFGATLNKDFYPGLPGLFRDLKKIGDSFDVSIEFYIISGGLQEVIEGTKIVQTHFKGVYGCQLAEDRQTGLLSYIKRCVTFTEKTRYLFEINKGLRPEQTRKNPYLVNNDVPDQKRRIPFNNMIYVGDGLTDIPCFSFLKKAKGTGFGVFDPGEESSAKRALLDFLKTDRVISMHAAKYRKTDELGSFLRAAVTIRCSQLRLQQEEAEE